MKQNELKIVLHCIDMLGVQCNVISCHRFCIPISSADGQLIGLSCFLLLNAETVKHVFLISHLFYVFTASVAKLKSTHL